MPAHAQQQVYQTSKIQNLKYQKFEIKKSLKLKQAALAPGRTS